VHLHTQMVFNYEDCVFSNGTLHMSKDEDEIGTLIHADPSHPAFGRLKTIFQMRTNRTKGINRINRPILQLVGRQMQPRFDKAVRRAG
jgi:hypothetical protein